MKIEGICALINTNQLIWLSEYMCRSRHEAPFQMALKTFIYLQMWFNILSFPPSPTSPFFFLLFFSHFAL